jgi:asparagine synthase (glutamine-hydrolysing)
MAAAVGSDTARPMCGICGYVGEEGTRADRHVIERMAGTLRPRGPDDAGFYIDGPVALGMRRLAIVDVLGGRQPIANEDETICVICNGEIYNQNDLRRDLAARGHRFRTRSDVEVIVHLYEEHGPDAIYHLNGMFALAIWDQRRGRLLLARDRMGQKPLYWCRLGSGLAFASEPKALLAHPELSFALDLYSLSRYLFYEYVPAPWSIYRGMYKLPRGHYLIYEQGRLTLRKYWDGWTACRLDFCAPVTARSPEEAAEFLWEHLCQSVRSQLMSDVPLGAFLSGGIDSGAVVAAMRAAGGDSADIQTFTIGFTEPSFDESQYARLIANAFHTEHHEEIFSIQHLLSLLPDVAAYLDEPFGDASVLPTHLLSRFARQRVTVCLAGDGGDELFAGYPTFQAERVAAWTRRLPRRSQVLAKGLAQLLPVDHRDFSLDFIVRQFVRGWGTCAALTHQRWLGSFSWAEQQQILDPAVVRMLEGFNPEEEHCALAEQVRSPDPINQLLALYQETYLAEDILTKADRASMATSLEVRAPFMDPCVVKLANSLPGPWKLRGCTGKWILKQALRRVLPRITLKRKKKGFGIPVAQWLSGELRSMAASLLAPDRLRRQRLFRPEAVSRLLHEHWAHRANHRKQLWTLLMFQLWWDQYGARLV